MSNESHTHATDGPISDALSAADAAVDKAAAGSLKVIDAVSDAVNDTVHAASKKAHHLVDASESDIAAALHKTDEISSTVQKSITDHPVRAIAIAAAVAAVLGFLMGAASRR